MGSRIDPDKGIITGSLLNSGIYFPDSPFAFLFITEEREAENTPDACHLHCFHGFPLGEVHVGKAGCAGLYHLDKPCEITGINILIGELVLDGEDLRKPLLKIALAVLVVSHQSHCQVSVGIDEAGEGYESRHVFYLIRSEVGSGARIGNFLILYQDVAFEEIFLTRHGNDGHVFKKSCHIGIIE